MKYHLLVSDSIVIAIFFDEFVYIFGTYATGSFFNLRLLCPINSPFPRGGGIKLIIQCRPFLVYEESPGIVNLIICNNQGVNKR